VYPPPITSGNGPL